MKPIPIPKSAKIAHPWMHLQSVGPPENVRDRDVGTVESLVGWIDGMYAFTDYWKPTPWELDILNEGGSIMLTQFTQQMMMHSMGVWQKQEED